MVQLKCQLLIPLQYVQYCYGQVRTDNAIEKRKHTGPLRENPAHSISPPSCRRTSLLVDAQLWTDAMLAIGEAGLSLSLSVFSRFITLLVIYTEDFEKMVTWLIKQMADFGWPKHHVSGGTCITASR